MGYVGNQQTEGFSQVPAKQDLTGATGTSLTLTHAVASAEGIDLFINNVRQEPTTAYSVGGDGVTVTLTGSVVATDDIYVVYNSLARQTSTHPSNQALQATSGTFSGDLTVDTNTFHVDSTNNRVGIGTSLPSNILHVSGTSGTPVLLERTNGAVCTLAFKGNTTTNNPYLGANGDDLYFNTGNANRLLIDSSGRVTIPYQPSFRAAGTIGNYTTTSPIPFASVQHNIGSHFSTGTNRFTAPIAGIYAFHAHIGFIYSNSTNKYAQIELRKNGNQVAYSYVQAQAVAHYSPCSVSALVELNANDYIEVIFQHNGTQYYNNSSECQFSGHLVS